MATDSLPQFIENVTGESHLRVEKDLGDGFVRLMTSEAERRQAKHDIRCVEDIVIEMLRNARDAEAGLIYLATVREGATRRIIMIDDGAGIPAHLHEAVFEPRVTSKLDTYHMDRWGIHGRGMALYAIRQNAEEARVMASAPGLGTAIRVVVDTGELPERTDQSSLPHLVNGEAGRRVMRGPRNINRMVAEFVTESADAPQVFVGSPVQIAATMYRAGRRAMGQADATLGDDRLADASGQPEAAPGSGNHPSANASGEATAASSSTSANISGVEGVPDNCPVCLAPALADSPEALAHVCSALGLDMSVRSARRIMDGQIDAAPPFLSVLAEADAGTGESPTPAGAASAQGASASREAQAVSDLHHPADARRVALGQEERAELANAVRRAWEPIARANYLRADVEPQVRVGKDGIRVFIPTVHDDGGQ